MFDFDCCLAVPAVSFPAAGSARVLARRMTAASLGEIPMTSQRRLIFLFTHAIGLVDHDLRPARPGKTHIGQHVRCRSLHEFCQFREALAQFVRNVPPLDHGRQSLLLWLARLHEGGRKVAALAATSGSHVRLWPPACPSSGRDIRFMNGSFRRTRASRWPGPGLDFHLHHPASGECQASHAQNRRPWRAQQAPEAPSSHQAVKSFRFQRRTRTLSRTGGGRLSSQTRSYATSWRTVPRVATTIMHNVRTRLEYS